MIRQQIFSVALVVAALGLLSGCFSQPEFDVKDVKIVDTSLADGVNVDIYVEATNPNWFDLYIHSLDGALYVGIDKLTKIDLRAPIELPGGETNSFIIESNFGFSSLRVLVDYLDGDKKPELIMMGDAEVEALLISNEYRVVKRVDLSKGTEIRDSMEESLNKVRKMRNTLEF